MSFAVEVDFLGNGTDLTGLVQQKLLDPLSQFQVIPVFGLRRGSLRPVRHGLGPVLVRVTEERADRIRVGCTERELVVDVLKVDDRGVETVGRAVVSERLGALEKHRRRDDEIVGGVVATAEV